MVFESDCGHNPRGCDEGRGRPQKQLLKDRFFLHTLHSTLALRETVPPPPDRLYRGPLTTCQGLYLSKNQGARAGMISWLHTFSTQMGHVLSSIVFSQRQVSVSDIGRL